MQIDNQLLEEFFKNRNIDATIHRSEFKNPLQKFWIRQGPKCDFRKLENLSTEIGLALKAPPPVMTPDFTDGTIRMELMTGSHPIVDFEALAELSGFNDFSTLSDKYELPVLLGTTDVDKPLIVDLASFPHLLIAGTTGSGKSISEHCIVQSLKKHAKSNRVKLVLMDPKFVEFHKYENVNSLYYDKPGVATTSDIIEERIEDLTKVMDERLKLLQQHGCRDLKEFRKKHPKHGSYIVIVIDELADLMKTTKKRFENSLNRLAAKSRAAGIHIVAATQYPHSDVVTSTIKANFDGRMCFRVSESTQSRVMLSKNGAEKLQGKGDGLISGGELNMQRFQGALVSLESSEPTKIGKIKSMFSKKIV